jgi:hypothetical protein
LSFYEQWVAHLALSSPLGKDKREHREALVKDSAAAIDRLEWQLGKGVESDARADRRIDLAERNNVLVGRMRCICACVMGSGDSGRMRRASISENHLYVSKFKIFIFIRIIYDTYRAHIRYRVRTSHARERKKCVILKSSIILT